jgi:hypothetical protein
MKAGEVLYRMSPRVGHTITNSSADTLTFQPGANTFDVEVMLVGTSA